MPGPLHSESYIQLDSSLLSTTSDLPAIVIYNFGAGGVPQDSDQFANLSLYEPAAGVTSLTNAATLTARAAIHVHGSSSAGIAKKAFSVGFQDDLGDDASYSPLGLPSESSFVLYAPDNFEPVLIQKQFDFSVFHNAVRLLFGLCSAENRSDPSQISNASTTAAASCSVTCQYEASCEDGSSFRLSTQ